MMENKCKADFSLNHVGHLFDAENNCLRHSLQYTIFLFAMFCFVWLVGLAGNFLIIGVIGRSQRLRTVTNWFIVNLAIANLVMLGFCLPVSFLGNVFIPWVMPGAICKAAESVQSIAKFSTVYSLAAIAVERCRAICRPLCLRRGFNRKQTGIIIVLIWLAALITSMPLIFVYEMAPTQHDPLPRYCQAFWGYGYIGKGYFFVVDMVLQYIFPLVVITVLTLLIMKSIRERQLPSPQQQHVGLQSNVVVVRRGARTSRLQIVRMLSGMSFGYFLGWLPYFILKTLTELFGFWAGQDEFGTDDMIIPLVLLIGYGYAGTNPYLYMMVNDNLYDAMFPQQSPFQNERFARRARRERRDDRPQVNDPNDAESEYDSAEDRHGMEMMEMGPRAWPVRQDDDGGSQ